MNMKKLFLLNLPYLLFVYPFDKLTQAFRLAPGSDLSGKLLSIGDGFTAALSSPWLSFHPTDLLIGIAGAVVLRMAVYLKGKNAKKYRQGIEYGSARWGTAADIAPYMDKNFFQNIPMTQTERITMASRPKQPKYARNKNILVIGGSGSGKTRFFCKPSLLQAHSSYVCTDPKGTLLPEIGTFLERKKYRIKCLNLINFRKSMKYNPLAYIRSEKDILKLVNALIMNTKGEGEKPSEDFWVKAERLYYSALIGYIWYEATEEEKNFITLLDLINASEAREDDETYQSPVDLLFSQLEEREPDHFAVKQYRKFKMAAGKTLKSMADKFCAVSFLQISAPEMDDRMLTELLDTDSGLLVSLHIRSMDQNEAIKTVKRKITDIDSMKIDAQKKAVREGFDMDIIPTDLATYAGEAKNILRDLQSRNERMFLMTFLVVNFSDSKQKLENDLLRAASVAQKYNCSLVRLDFQQEDGFVSALPLGVNCIKIQRGLTTSAVAVFVPFTTQEIFHGGEALYYGLNATSGNMILADRKKLKTPNGMILSTPGSGKSFSAKRSIVGVFLNTKDDILICDPEAEYFPLEDDYGMIDGVINNGRRGEELEKAQEYAERTTPEKPSIRERLEDAKRECAEHKPPEGKKPGRDVPEHDCL